MHPFALENCMWTSLIGKDELFPFHGLRGSSFDVSLTKGPQKLTLLSCNHDLYFPAHDVRDESFN